MSVSWVEVCCVGWRAGLLLSVWIMVFFTFQQWSVCAPVVQFTWRHWTWSRHWCFCVCLHPFLLLLSYYGDPSLQGHWRSLQLCINTEIIINFCFHFDVWEVILLEKLTISMCMALNFYFYFRHAKFVEICAQTVELFASQDWWVAVW